MTREAHILSSGYLSDAPGRNESWTEYVTYLGGNRWRLTVEGTSFDGSPGETYIEKMGSRPLIKWCRERDGEESESLAHKRIRGRPSDSEQDDDEEEMTFSEREDRLLEIAKEENATFCVACLEGLASSTWPPQKRLPALRILSITGVTKRGVWLHVYRTAFRVETTRGPGYLERLDDNRFAKLVLQSESSMSQGTTVRVPTRLLPRIKELQPEFDARDAVRGP